MAAGGPALADAAQLVHYTQQLAAVPRVPLSNLILNFVSRTNDAFQDVLRRHVANFVAPLFTAGLPLSHVGSISHSLPSQPSEAMKRKALLRFMETRRHQLQRIYALITWVSEVGDKLDVIPVSYCYTAAHLCSSLLCRWQDVVRALDLRDSMYQHTMHRLMGLVRQVEERLYVAKPFC